MIYAAVGSALNPLNTWEQKIEFLVLFQLAHLFLELRIANSLASVAP